MKNWYTLHINIMQGVPIFVNLFGTGSHAVWGYPHPVLATLGESQKSLYPLPSLLFRCFCDFQSFLYLKNAVFKINQIEKKAWGASPPKTQKNGLKRGASPAPLFCPLGQKIHPAGIFGNLG